jgi:high-affinity iron transporter
VHATRRDGTWATGQLVLVLLAVALVAAAAAARATAAPAPAPWQSFDALDAALFDAELAATPNDRGSMAAAGRRASAAADRLAAGFDPSAGASARRLRSAADAVASEQSSVGLAIAAASARTAALSGAYETALAATRAGKLDEAGNWLLVREFKPVTRFAHPSAAASVAIASLSDGVVPRARAVQSIRGDLLDTYEALLRASLADTQDAFRAGLPEKAAGSAATARGYWWILHDAYAGQRGEARAGQLDASFDRVVAAARSGRPAATAAAASAVEDQLLSFRAAPLTASEQARRAGQLIRYLGLVPIEYGRGVAAGSVVVPIEIQEAIAFRDGAAIAFGELQSYLARRDLAATRSVRRVLTELDSQLGDAERGSAVADPDAVGRLAKTATAALDGAYPADWKAGTAEADFDVIATLLEKVSALAAAGDMRRAESSRLEAYATFELGPEQRLRGLAPSLFQRVEGLFWYGADGHAGLAQLMRQNANAGELAETMSALDLALKESAEAIGSGPQSQTAVIVNSSIIVFREGLEAVLILAALMASMVGAQRGLRRPLMAGVLVALVASALTWVVAQTVLGSLAGWGERLEAVVSLVAIGVLLLILNWFYHRVYWQENLQDLHKKKKRVLAGASIGIFSAQAIGLVALGFSSVYREGFETVLFLQALTLEAGAWTVLQGVLLGFAGVVGVFALVVALERRLPHKKMLVATGLLITGVLAVLVGHTVQTMQVVGWMPITPVDGLTLPFWTGTWLGLFPTWEGLTLQGAAIVFVLGSYVVAEALRARKRRRLIASVATPSVSPADLPGEMGELRFEELLPRQANGLRRAGHRDDDRPAVRAGGRAGEHRRRADLREAEHPEELAESRERLLEQSGESVVRRVAS